MARIQGIYIALFGRPADPEGLEFWTADTKGGTDLSSLIGRLTAAPEYLDRVDDLSPTDMINSIYQFLFDRDADADGLEFYLEELSSGRQSIETIAINILDGAGGTDVALIEAKIDAADLFTARLNLEAEVNAYAGDFAEQVGREFIDSVSAADGATEAETDAAILRLFGPGEGQGPGEEPGNGNGGGGGGGVNPVDGSPISNADAFATNEDTPVSGNVLTNDVDPEFDFLQAFLVAGPQHGTLVLNTDGSFIYTPNANFFGTDSFTYRSNDGATFGNEATVSLTVNSVNDAPVTSVADVPVQVTSVNENNAATVIADVDATDVDTADTIQFSIKTEGDATFFTVDKDTGILTLNAGVNYEALPADDKVLDVTVVATDAAGATSEQSFDVTVNDVNDNPVITFTQTVFTAAENNNAAIVIGTGNVTDEDDGVSPPVLSGDDVTKFEIIGNSLFLKDGVDFESLPANDKVLNVTITALDGRGGVDVENVAVTITNVNEAPVANNDVLTATEDTTRIFSVQDFVANDTDVDTANSDLKIGSITGATGGTATLNANGTVSFTPTANFNGPATISYTVTDGSETSAAATATINVAAVNDAPVFSDNNAGYAFTKVEGTLNVIGKVVATDVDAGSTVTYSFAAGTTDAIKSVFGINPTTGDISLISARDYEVENQREYNFSVTATSAGQTDTAAVKFTTTNNTADDRVVYSFATAGNETSGTVTNWKAGDLIQIDRPGDDSVVRFDEDNLQYTNYSDAKIAALWAEDTANDRIPYDNIGVSYYKSGNIINAVVAVDHNDNDGFPELYITVQNVGTVGALSAADFDFI